MLVSREVLLSAPNPHKLLHLSIHFSCPLLFTVSLCKSPGIHCKSLVPSNTKTDIFVKEPELPDTYTELHKCWVFSFLS